MIMTQEDKELLLKDLCGRLPYGVTVGYSGKDSPDTLDKIGRVIYIDIRFGMIQMQAESGTLYGLPPSEFIKPYLRPMSSMTGEEKEELEHIMGESVIVINEKFSDFFYVEDIYQWDNLYGATDWLNSHRFDYRGLIQKGLALEVTPDNNPYV